MAEFDNKTREIVQRLQAIRVKMLREQPFYAVLLMHLRFALDESTPTLYTDGERIAFNPYFVDELDDFQLQFVLMHEILHVALGHCTSEEKDFNHKAYNIACDIVVNSNIMYSLGLIKEKVDYFGNKSGYEVKKEVEIDGEPLIHKAPDGIEGVELDAKEVYALLLKAYPELAKEDEQKQENRDKSKQESSNKKSNKGKAQGGKTQGASDETSDDNSDEANNKRNQSNKSNTSGKENSSDEGEAKGESDDEGADSETNGDNGETEGTDSNEKNDDSDDAGGENGDADSGSAGDGDCSNMDGDAASNTTSGGGRFADGELDELDDRDQDGEGNSVPIYSNTPNNSKLFNEFDDHSFWDVSDELSNEQKEENEIWTTRMVDATEIAEQISIEFGGTGRGLTPLAAERVIKELKEVQTDWRTVLENFIQEEINDYSFSPPDRRFEDSPFFLPDFNEKDERVEDILFMIDTSGSMSNEQITTAYSEIKGAIDQFDGKLKGWLGFFDAVIVKPQEFENEDEFKIIRPAGGGGTSFDIIFEYVQHEMRDKPPASIIILTDGYAPFPDEKEAMGIPVLWIINNENARPPWGKVTRIKD